MLVLLLTRGGKKSGCRVGRASDSFVFVRAGEVVREGMDSSSSYSSSSDPLDKLAAVLGGEAARALHSRWLGFVQPFLLDA